VRACMCAYPRRRPPHHHHAGGGRTRAWPHHTQNRAQLSLCQSQTRNPTQNARVCTCGVDTCAGGGRSRARPTHNALTCTCGVDTCAGGGSTRARPTPWLTHRTPALTRWTTFSRKSSWSRSAAWVWTARHSRAGGCARYPPTGCSAHRMACMWPCARRSRAGGCALLPCMLPGV